MMMQAAKLGWAVAKGLGQEQGWGRSSAGQGGLLCVGEDLI